MNIWVVVVKDAFFLKKTCCGLAVAAFDPTLCWSLPNPNQSVFALSFAFAFKGIHLYLANKEC